MSYFRFNSGKNYGPFDLTGRLRFSKDGVWGFKFTKSVNSRWYIQFSDGQVFGPYHLIYKFKFKNKDSQAVWSYLPGKGREWKLMTVEIKK